MPFTRKQNSSPALGAKCHISPHLSLHHHWSTRESWHYTEYAKVCNPAPSRMWAWHLLCTAWFWWSWVRSLSSLLSSSSLTISPVWCFLWCKETTNCWNLKKARHDPGHYEVVRTGIYGQCLRALLGDPLWGKRGPSSFAFSPVLPAVLQIYSIG